MAFFGAQKRMGHKYIDTSQPLYGLGGGSIGVENISGWGNVWPDGQSGLGYSPTPPTPPTPPKPTGGSTTSSSYGQEVLVCRRMGGYAPPYASPPVPPKPKTTSGGGTSGLGGFGEYELRGMGEYELRGLGGFGEYELRGLGTTGDLPGPSVMNPDNITTLLPEFWMPAGVEHISFTYPGKEPRNEGRTFWTLGVPPPSFGYDPADVARGFGCSKRVVPEAQGGVPLGKCLDVWAGAGNFVAAVYGSGECGDGGWQITKVPVAQAMLLRKDAYGAASGFRPYLLAMPGLAYPTQQSWAPYILAVTGLRQGGGLPGSEGKTGGVVAAGMGGSKLVPILLLAGLAYWIWGLPLPSHGHCANMPPCPDAAQTPLMT